jgi:hypothetical protein
LRIVAPLVSLLTVLAAAPLGAEPLGDVEACVRANAPGQSRVGAVAMRSIDRTGAKRTLEGRMHWKRDEQGLSKMLVELELPPDVRGSSYLVVERESGQDMWVYLPDLGKVRRIHPRTISGRLFGTDFSYEDVARLERISRGRAERLPDAVLADRPVYRVRALPEEEDLSAYSRVEYFLDRTTCLPLRIEFYALDGVLRKVLTGDPASQRRAGAGWVLGSVRIEDLVSGTESQLVLTGFEADVELPDRLFRTSHLERGN